MSKDLFFEQREKEESFINDLNEIPEPAFLDIDFAKEINHFVEKVKEGEADIEMYFKFIYKLEKQIKKAKEEILPYVILHYENYEAEELKEMGVKFTHSGRYDYSHDSEYARIKQMLDERAEYLKMVYNKMKNPNSQPEIDMYTGEIIIGAMYKPSKKSISLSKF